jgi:cytochrome c oxidase subunit I
MAHATQTHPAPARPRDSSLPYGHAEENYINQQKGLWSWLTTVDHKRIGLMYLGVLILVFMTAGLSAIMVRTELLTQGKTIMSADGYNFAFTFHGVLMTFAFLVPVTPAILGNFVLPLQLGAKDVAFPRLNLLSWYIYMIGGGLIFASLLIGKMDTGWTFYTPYSIRTNGSVLFLTVAIFIAGFSSILTGLNFIVTIHKMRAPGLTWNRLPLFVWAMYAVSLVQILATPVLGVTMLLLFFERILGIGIFDPALGGDPVLFQHFFWFYSHPAVYIMILPAFGIVSELMATFSRQRVYGYRAVALSSVAIALLGFLVWGHHMFVSGESTISAIIFSLITYLIGIPSGIKVFNWVMTMYKGSVWLKTPMIYAMMFLFLFTIGGLTGIMVGVLAVDVHLHDTYYVVAHFHYVMMGGTVIALIGGMYYWFPKMFGKMYPERPSQVAAVLVFIGFNVTFFTQFIMGSQGMPRRYYDYIEDYATLHAISTIGSYILALGLFTVLGTWIWGLLKGPKASQNPWAAATLEWTHATTPPDAHNFDRTPLVTRGPYDFHLVEDLFGPPAGDGSGDGTGDGATPRPATPVPAAPAAQS